MKPDCKTCYFRSGDTCDMCDEGGVLAVNNHGKKIKDVVRCNVYRGEVMKEVQFKAYIEEKNYFNHLDKLKKEIVNVCNRVDCTKHPSASKDKQALFCLVDSLRAATVERMEAL